MTSSSRPALPEASAPSEDEALLRRYLTGALAEEAAEEVERRLLFEDDLFKLAEAVEREVLADWARGGLSSAEAESVRRRYSASSLGRAHLALVEDLTALTRTKESGSEALLAQVYRLLEQSRVAAIEDPQGAEEPARRALALVDRLAGEDFDAAGLADLRATVWGRIANSVRVRGDLLGAAAAFETAWDHWHVGTGDALTRARLLKLEASLRRGQREFAQARDRLHEVLPIFLEAGENRLALETLLSLSNVYGEEGKSEQAHLLLQQALDLIDPESDPRLALMARHNLIDNFLDLGRFHEAAGLLARTRPLYARFPDPWTQNRLQWMEGRVARSLGRLAEAEGFFHTARQGFLAENVPYDVALVSLDLASVYAEQGRTEEMKPLAQEMVAVFSSYAIHREALAAVIFLEQAAAAEQATLEVVARIASFLQRASRNPDLCFRETVDG